MRTHNHTHQRIVWILVCICFGTTAYAEEPGFAEVLSAVVGVRAQIPEDARTAEVLGTERVGSGIVIDDDGLVVTIGYLILEAASVEILLPDDMAVPGRIVAYDHDTGFGLVRAQTALGVRAMPLGNSQKIAATDSVLMASFGGLETVRPAKVASRRVFAGYWEYLLDNAIFTAPAYPLFGGAALLDSDGSLLGVGSLAVSDAISGHYLPGNMFVPTEKLIPIMGDLLAHGRSEGTRRPWLGVYSEEISGRVLVTRVADGGPAAAAGITSGDVILA
ncbi:MAG: S1C family serine protease, partial [Gammaproteobacteria bacterium]|nr:S1C family serine protease [Gammaproteobacteria bacterium]